MSKRLQVLLPDHEMDEIRRLARRQGVTVGECVRQVLRKARSQQSIREPDAKLKAVRKAVQHSFPTADIEDMLAQIEQGYRK